MVKPIRSVYPNVKSYDIINWKLSDENRNADVGMNTWIRP